MWFLVYLFYDVQVLFLALSASPELLQGPLQLHSNLIAHAEEDIVRCNVNAGTDMSLVCF